MEEFTHQALVSQKVTAPDGRPKAMDIPRTVIEDLKGRTVALEEAR
jgi:hypothetical protein